jgi:hypothetical protein
MSSPVTKTTSETAEPRTRITDSPWFWVYLFSTGAFAALMLMQTKYHNRQGHLERVYRYGTRTLAKPAGATLSNGAGLPAPIASPNAAATSDVADDSDASSADDSGEQPPFAAGPHPPAQKLLISLEPLRIIAGATMVVSFIALQWCYLRRRAKALP